MNAQHISPRFTFQLNRAYRRHASTLRRAAWLLLALCAFSSASAQSESSDGGQSRTERAVVVVAATDAGVRFIAPGAVVETRLEVFSSSGEKIFDSDSRRGNVLDWSPAIGARAQSAPADGDYLCVLTLRDLSGQARRRQAIVSLASGKVALLAADPARLSAAQTGALAGGSDSQTGAEGEGVWMSLLGGGEAAAALTTHDGQDGQLTSTTGALTFRTGDLFAGRDKEQMRVTPDGRVGIGTDNPQATLDVAGAVRVSEGVKFSDGTTLNSTGGKLIFSNAEGDTIPAPNAAGTGTQNRVAKWTETGGAGTLGDSAMTEVDGKVGIGTTTPVGLLEVRSAQPDLAIDLSNTANFARLLLKENGAERAAFQSIGSTFSIVNRRSAMEFFNNFGPVLFFTASNGAGLERVRIDTAGNVGIGTTTPAAKLDVAGSLKLSVVGGGITFPDGSIQTTASTGGGVTGTGTTNTVPLWTGTTALGNSVITQSSGNVGVGVASPSQKLDVAGNIKASGSLIGASANVVGNLTVDTSTLLVDATNNRVGIGTTTPSVPLDVVGDINTSTQYKLGGVHALSNTGVDNLFAGAGAGAVNTGIANTFFGASAGASNAGGDDNSFFGRFAGSLNVNSNNNSFFGSNAGAANVNGFDNSFFGSNAGAVNTASSNSFFGSGAGVANTSGSNNAFFGEDAGAANVTGSSNSFYGTSAGAANTASLNSFFGKDAGLANTSGTSNSFFGASAGDSNTTGGSNAFFGNSAGAANTTGGSNSFFGGAAGNNSTASNNSFFGHFAGNLNTSGASNAFFGESAGETNTTGGSNSFFGKDAGLSNTTESSNTFLGASSNGAAGITNATAIGASAVVTQSDSLVLGNGVKVGVGTSAPKEKLHIGGGNILIDSVTGGLILKSPNGLTCAKLTIDNAGALVTTVVTCP